MRTLNRSLQMILNNLKSNHMAVFGASSESNMELDYVSILAGYCSDISDGKVKSEIRRCLPVRKPYVRCSGKMQYI